MDSNGQILTNILSNLLAEMLKNYTVLVRYGLDVDGSMFLSVAFAIDSFIIHSEVEDWKRAFQIEWDEYNSNFDDEDGEKWLGEISEEDWLLESYTNLVSNIIMNIEG